MWWDINTDVIQVILIHNENWSKSILQSGMHTVNCSVRLVAIVVAAVAACCQRVKCNVENKIIRVSNKLVSRLIYRKVEKTKQKKP